MSTEKIKDGGPAFPVALNEFTTAQAGMTLRDWFAGRAPLPEYAEAALAMAADVGPFGAYDWWCRLSPSERLTATTRWRYMYADAMLKAREAQP